MGSLVGRDSFVALGVLLAARIAKNRRMIRYLEQKTGRLEGRPVHNQQ
jgi:hypothetical protein